MVSVFQLVKAVFRFSGAVSDEKNMDFPLEDFEKDVIRVFLQIDPPITRVLVDVGMSGLLFNLLERAENRLAKVVGMKFAGFFTISFNCIGKLGIIEFVKN